MKLDQLWILTHGQQGAEHRQGPQEELHGVDWASAVESGFHSSVVRHFILLEVHYYRLHSR
jgi:hypothetical protein